MNREVLKGVIEAISERIGQERASIDVELRAVEVNANMALKLAQDLQESLAVSVVDIEAQFSELPAAPSVEDVEELRNGIAALADGVKELEAIHADAKAELNEGIASIQAQLVAHLSELKAADASISAAIEAESEHRAKEFNAQVEEVVNSLGETAALVASAHDNIEAVRSAAEAEFEAVTKEFRDDIEVVKTTLTNLAARAESLAEIRATPGPTGEKGDPGDKGDRGEPGAPGEAPSAEEIVEVLIDKHSDLLRPEPGPQGEKGEPGVDGVAPTAEEVVAILLEKHADELRGKGVNLEEVTVELVSKHGAALRGEKGDTGANGRDGAGIEAPRWEPGIYREGSVVQHDIGRYSRAKKDTSADPSDKSDDWERIGNAGLAWTGLKDENREYQEGDLFIDDGSMFGYFDGKIKMICKRGRDGKVGPKGDIGPMGAPAPHAVEFVMDAEKAHIVLSDGTLLAADVTSMVKSIAVMAAKIVEEQFADMLGRDV